MDTLASVGGGSAAGAGGDGGASMGGLEQTVGPNGFRNIKPRTRQQRRQLADKETLEKARLRDRTGGFHKYTDYGKDLTAQVDGSVGYIPEADRFHTDVAGEEKLMREARLARAEVITHKRRELNALREEDRWARMDRDAKEDEEKWHKLREDGEKARRNKSSVPYNPLTLQYHDTEDGTRLKYSDDLIKYRAAQRAQNLQKKNVSTDYNPITGDDVVRSPEPKRPVVPDFGGRPGAL